jgi:hypothetical protein
LAVELGIVNRPMKLPSRDSHSTPLQEVPSRKCATSNITSP